MYNENGAQEYHDPKHGIKKKMPWKFKKVFDTDMLEEIEAYRLTKKERAILEARLWKLQLEKEGDMCSGLILNMDITATREVEQRRDGRRYEAQFGFKYWLRITEQEFNRFRFDDKERIVHLNF